MSTSGGGGRRADAVRNRQLALDAATALLAAESGAVLTVEAIAKKAGLGVGTVVRAFGGKDSLLDAAVSGLLEPVVQRGRDLLAQTRPEHALRTFLADLMAFQSAHHGISDHLDGFELPATTALRAQLVTVVGEMIAGAQAGGAIRADLDPAVITTVIGQTAYAIASTRPASRELADAYLTVLMDGLRPPPSTQDVGPTRRSRHVSAPSRPRPG